MSAASTKQDHFESIRKRFESIDAPFLLIEWFRRQYRQLISGHTGLIDRTQIRPVEDLADASELSSCAPAGEEALNKTVCIKLNGGLGTSMGLNGPKSMLMVKDGQSFLDIVIKQILSLREAYDVRTPLVLMNSFSTQDETLAVLQRHAHLLSGQRGIPPTFMQHRVPKLLASTFAPADWPADPDKTWCPPGHGDLYCAIVTSGLLDDLLASKYEYAFVSNVDNLGATLDTAILGFFALERYPFMMEVADRTPADRKGGHLARNKDGQLILRESAQCPPADEDEFQDIEKYRYFNTNNLWINLKALKDELRRYDGVLDLPLIVNAKPLDPRDDASPEVVQLETAMGAAIQSFTGSQALRVTRSRFAPVKTTDDLLVLRSDVYTMRDNGVVTMVEGRAQPPTVHLDPRYYRKVDDFELRFPEGAPSLKNCETLTINGDFRFGKDIQVQGNALLENESDQPEAIVDGSALKS